MAVYVVTGKLGSGKTLVAVSRIQEYLNQGRMVATNLNLNLEYLINPFAKNSRVIRVSDRPTAEELDALPTPYEGDYSESKSGLLVFDECATWFNSRTWNDKGRTGLINWLLHARKLGWDIIFIIQNVSMMDAQAREGFAEHVVHCRRLDRLSIPFVTWFFRMGGLNIRPPKLHWGIVKYGASDSSPVIEKWVYTGTALYDAYDTRQVFSEGSCGMHSMLPPNTIYGRYTNAREHTKRRFNSSANKLLGNAQPRAAFFIGLLLASVAWYLIPTNIVAATEQAQAKPQSETKTETKAPPTSPLEGVSITASVKGSKSFDYVFQRGNEVFYPEHLDYQVRFISECKAALIRGKFIDYVTCSPFVSSSEAPQPREGAAAQREEQDGTISSNVSSNQSDTLTASN